MIDTLQLLDDLKLTFEPTQAETLAKLMWKLYVEMANTVTKEEFRELTEIVRILGERVDRLAEAQERTEQRVSELAEAQKRTEESLESFKKTTEENFNRVWKAIDELAEAQKRTEESLESFKKTTEENFNRVWKAIDELAEAQKRTEESLESFKKTTEENFNRVWKAIDELAEAQKRTEESLESFKKTTEENFNRVWKAIDELAEAQKRTEEELRKLVGEHKKTREHLGSLSHTVGYVLEDRAYRGLVGLLKRDFGLEVIDGLKRDYIEVGRDKYEEINIIGRAKDESKDVWVIGECKSQLKKGDVDDFLKSVKRIDPFVKGEKLLVAVTYQTPPPVRNYAEQKGIKLYFSYELPL